MTAPTPGASRDRTSSRPVRWLVAAGLVAVVGLTAVITWAAVAVVGALGEPDHFTRVAIPGSAAVEMRRGDQLVVYYEGPGARTTSQTPALADLGVRVTAPGGAPADLRPYAGTQRYDHAGGVGTAVGTISAGTTGQYTITATGPAGGDGVLAIGASMTRTAVTGLLGPGVVGVAVVVLALVIATAPFTRPRTRSTR